MPQACDGVYYNYPLYPPGDGEIRNKANLSKIQRD